MLSWIIQITLVSVILIFLVHHLINFFKSTLTVPKIKDLVNSPHQKYENMFDIIKNNSNKSNTSENNISYSLIDLLPKTNEPSVLSNPSESSSPSEPSMKNELKNFLKKQLNNSSNGTEIAILDSMSNIDSYSQFN
jgi:hypothetical protein